MAISLSGYTSGPNLLPQATNFNVSAYAGLEHSLREALRGGCTVEVDSALTQGDEPDTPALIVTHWEDWTEEILVLLNEDHAQ